MRHSILIFALSLINFVLLSQGTVIEDSYSYNLTIKNYELVQTEIRTLDNQLVYADTQVKILGEQSVRLEVEEVHKPFDLTNPKKKEYLQVGLPNRNSLLLAYEDNQLDTQLARELLHPNFNNLRINSSKSLQLGNDSYFPEKTIPNLAILSTPINRSITERPGYVAGATFNIPFNK